MNQQYTQEDLVRIRQQIAVYADQEERERCEESLGEFVKHAWSAIDSSHFKSCWAIDAMCDHLEAVTLGEISRLLINIPPRCAKPVAHDARIMSQRGVIPLDQIVVGDLVLTHKGRWRRVNAVHDNGKLPVVRITTKTGRIVEAAPDHPFLTPSGWLEAGKLAADDVVGLVPLHPVGDESGTPSISVEAARLLGYLVGDGCCKGTPNVTCADDIEAEDIKHCAASLGFRTVDRKYKITKTGYWLRSISFSSTTSQSGKTRKGYRGPVRTWLEYHGLWDQSSYTKMIPEVVVQGTRAVVAAFLGAYWSCDGYVVTRGAKRDGVEREDIVLGCDSVNANLLRQIQLMLLRLGINSRIRRKHNARVITKKQGAGYTSYSLTVSTQDDAWRFADQIKFFHKKYEKLIGARKRRFDFDRTLIGDVVETVESAGTKHCICLTVDEDNSFTAEGFAVHNTSIVSILYPAWVWARSEINFLSGPGVRFLCASYGHSLALNSANKARRVIMSPFFQKHWGDKVTLRSDQNTKNQFDTTSGGSYAATSVGGSLLGMGGDYLIGDDLNKVGKGAELESDAEREAVEGFWSEFSSTRLNDPQLSAIINVQQRLHNKDVSGLILDGDEDYVHLRIPMRYEKNYDYHTVILPQYEEQVPWDDPRAEADVEGELMWPERFDEASVKRLEGRLGPYLSAGRLQQRPSPKGGGILQRDWWQRWDNEEAKKYGLEWRGDQKLFPPFELVVASLDTAFGLKQENDYSALTVWGIFLDKNKNRRFMMAYAWAERLPLHGTVVSAEPGEPKEVFEVRKRKAFGLTELVADTCKRYKVQRLLIEDKTRGRDVAEEITRLYARENWGVQLVNPTTDKVSRAHAVVPLFTDGAVWYPNTIWAEKVIAQCEEFPKGTNDDYVDSVTMACNWARDNGILMRADEANYALEDDMRYKPPQKSVSEMYGV